MSQPLRFGVAYDFRNPPDSGIKMPDLYSQILDQIEWLDGYAKTSAIYRFETSPPNASWSFAMLSATRETG